MILLYTALALLLIGAGIACFGVYSDMRRDPSGMGGGLIALFGAILVSAGLLLLVIDGLWRLYAA